MEHAIATFMNFEIHICGQFRVTDPTGTDVTPKGAKSCAILALIATQDQFSRPRAWLQSILWPRSTAKAGMNSLRAELSKLDSHFAFAPGFFTRDRMTASLNPSQVKVICDPNDTQGFLASISVKESPFIEWRDGEQPKWLRPAITGMVMADISGFQQNLLCLFGSGTQDVSLRAAELSFMELAAVTLRDYCDVAILPKRPDGPVFGRYRVDVMATRGPDQTHILNMVLEDCLTSIAKWNASRRVPAGANPQQPDLGILALINQLAGQVCFAFSNPHNMPDELASAAGLASSAIHHIFSIESDGLAKADALLEQAYDMNPKGVYQAWRAQLLTIQHVERFVDDPEMVRDVGESLCADALKHEPDNSNVLAAIANFKTIIDRNVIAGIEMSRKAVRANPANPLAWWSFSNATQYTDDRDMTYLAAKRAHELSGGTKVEFWSGFQRSLSAALIGREQEAIHLGEVSSVLAPAFKPSLRYLIPLYVRNGFMDDAQRTIKRLKRKESDFSVDRMINDPSYPISVMRNNNMVDTAHLKDLSED